MVNLCKNLNLSILNGKTQGDIFGKNTCFRWNGCSVVDYAICCESICHSISSFKVASPILWLSDHAPIVLEVLVKADMATTEKTKLDALPAHYQWEMDSEERLILSLKSEEISNKFSDIISAGTHRDTTISANNVTNVLKLALENANIKVKIKNM